MTAILWGNKVADSGWIDPAFKQPEMTEDQIKSMNGAQANYQREVRELFKIINKVNK